MPRRPMIGSRDPTRGATRPERPRPTPRSTARGGPTKCSNVGLKGRSMSVHYFGVAWRPTRSGTSSATRAGGKARDSRFVGVGQICGSVTADLAQAAGAARAGSRRRGARRAQEPRRALAWQRRPRFRPPFNSEKIYEYGTNHPERDRRSYRAWPRAGRARTVRGCRAYPLRPA